ncbi:MAG: retropepsin-like aspartic protease family protein [Gammaproteobacteria bacterium]
MIRFRILHSAVRWTGRILLLAMFCVHAEAREAVGYDDLLSQIESLRQRMNIQIVGLEKLDAADRVRVSGSLEQQLLQALPPFNHVISRNQRGQIEKIVILGKKQKHGVDRLVLPARYENGHFLVAIAVSGDGLSWETVDMIVDTGADLVVLPESMIDQLGMADHVFEARKMQTANGEVDARVGTLHEVRIAGDVLNDVGAAFIDNQLLANNSLLGMSVLGRYKLMIDRRSQVITLFRK